MEELPLNQYRMQNSVTIDNIWPLILFFSVSAYVLYVYLDIFWERIITFHQGGPTNKW